MLLPDVNVWLALAFERHSSHALAKRWFDSLGDDECCFCRLTQQGFLRLSTNPKAVGDSAVSLAEAWQLYDSILADERISLVGEPQGVESAWRELTSAQTYSHRIWSDAYLAAFARDAGLQLVSLDSGFSQYPDLNWHLVR